MELLTAQTISQILSGLGLSSIFVVFIYFLWRDNKDKDKRNRDQNDKLLDAFIENTKTMETVANSLQVNTQATKKQTEVLDRFRETMQKN